MRRLNGGVSQLYISGLCKGQAYAIPHSINKSLLSNRTNAIFHFEKKINVFVFIFIAIHFAQNLFQNTLLNYELKMNELL